LARPTKGGRRRRKQGPVRWPLAMAVLVTITVLVGGGLYLVSRTPHPPTRGAKPRTAERQKLPARVSGYPEGQGAYSSAKGPPPEEKRVPVGGKGAIAIIVDDMGNSRLEAEQLLKIGVPLTFSIIPGLAHVREVADAAHRKGGEVMVHIPMEPKGVETKPFEKNGLLLSMSDEELTRRMHGYLDAVPYAAGANNHMGSRFTEDGGKMRIVLDLLKERNMFFVDSKTSPSSVGDRLAREMGVRTTARNVFLDNEQDLTAIRKQIGQLAAIARRKGSAVGICHPHKSTIQALTATLPALKGEGVTFVHASDLVR